MITERILVAGYGGQGIMTIGKLLATAAMNAGRHCTYMPSYGPEVRGGTANCAVVISDEEINSPNVETADTLIVLNQASYDKFRAQLTPGGLLLLNSSMAQTDDPMERASAADVRRIPATEAAQELGNIRVANVLIVGAYAAARGGMGLDDVLPLLKKELGGRAHLIEANRQAFLKGQELA